MGIQNSILYFPQMTILTTTVQFRCFDLNIFFSLTWKFDGDSKSDIVLSLKWLSGQQKSNFVVSGPIWITFFLWLRNSMGIPNPIFELRFYECCHSCFFVCKLVSYLIYQKDIYVFPEIKWTCSLTLKIFFFLLEYRNKNNSSVKIRKRLYSN